MSDSGLCNACLDLGPHPSCDICGGGPLEKAMARVREALVPVMQQDAFFSLDRLLHYLAPVVERQGYILEEVAFGEPGVLNLRLRPKVEFITVTISKADLEDDKDDS